MTDEEKTNYFVELYMAALRAYSQNFFLRAPNPTSERFKNLNKAREIVDRLGGEYADYIRFQFQAFKKIKIAPRPEHLVSLSSIKRYIAHQKKINLYNTKEYFTHGDYFTVIKTQRIYHLSQVLLPVSQDMDAISAYAILEQYPEKDISEVEKKKEDIFYLEAKLKYKRALFPEKLKTVLTLIS